MLKLFFLKKLKKIPHLSTDLFYSQNLVSLIYGSVQSGKTGEIKKLIDKGAELGYTTILSLDNRIDHLKQFMERVENIYNIQFIIVSATNAVKKVKTCFRRNQKFVLVMLNNHSQLNKLERLLTEQDLRNKKFVVIHDEGDLVPKNQNTETVELEQAKSHQGWINVMNSLSRAEVVRRVFVSATPENCLMFYKVKIDSVYAIPQKREYTSYENIIHFDIDECEDEIEMVKEEVERIKNSQLQAILINTDYLTSEQENKCLGLYATHFPDCLSHTYNGHGMTVYTTNPLFERELILLIGKLNIRKNVLQPHVYSFKNLKINQFYSLCKKINEKVIITVGMNLIDRGISFVSEDKEQPVIASTMFYRPGDSLPVTTLIQTIGRLLGNARPDLPRHLYCSEKVYLDYINMNLNQILYLQKIKENKETTPEEEAKKSD